MPFDKRRQSWGPTAERAGSHIP